MRNGGQRHGRRYGGQWGDRRGCGRVLEGREGVEGGGLLLRKWLRGEGLRGSRRRGRELGGSRTILAVCGRGRGEYEVNG